MKTSFWRHWWNSLRGATRSSPIARVRPRRQPLGLEALEYRVTPSLTPQMVLDINPGTMSSHPYPMVAIGSTTYFAADDGVHGVVLWKSDGTAAGTVLVKDIDTSSTYDYVSFLTNVNGTLFFSAYTYLGGYSLWKSDGTPAGTVPVSFSFRNFVGYLANVNGTLFFNADDGEHGYELWKSDGTAAGTTLVKDIWPGGVGGYYGGYWPNGSYPKDLTNVNGTLFFTAQDGIHDGSMLWKSDGTAAGTVLVKDIRSDGLGALPPMLTNVNGTLFLQANDGVSGPELWKSDGTAAGTTLVKDIYSGIGGSYPGSLASVNGTLFFSARNATAGRELWKSDGTAAGTVLVKDINPGNASSNPSHLANVNGTLFFSAYNATTGYELWKSDSTTAGTVLVEDINPGSASSSPSSLTNVDGTLFFSADDGIHGSELWMLPSAGTPAPPTLRINDVTVAEGHSGIQSASFTVTLSRAADQSVTVNYATANGMAAGGSDYQATSGTLTIAGGQTTGTITVLVNGDRLGEANETFFVNLSSPTYGTIEDGQGVGTIVDDEPRISISDVAKQEGRQGQTTFFTFTVTLSAAYDQAVTMSFRTVNGTAKTSEGDYLTQSGTLTFNPGETAKTITIEVKGDSKKEANETFYVDLFGNSGNSLLTKKRGIGTILNDD
jgi:ELWxxDGT repeat protein